MAEDRILIKDLLLRGIIGINDWEREKPQDILINLTLYAELSEAGKSDSIQDTANYRTITKRIIAHVENTARFTVEALAQDIATICLQDPNVQRAKVKVEKPSALRFAESVGVEIQRSKEDLG